MESLAACRLLSSLRIFLVKVSFNHRDIPDLRRHVLGLHRLQHEVVGVGPQLHEARPALGPHAAPVVLVIQILNTLEVKRLDDPVIAEVELGAAAGGHDGGALEAVHLADPQPELVGDAGLDRGDGEVDVLEAHALVQVEVEVLVRVDAAQLVKTWIPDGAAHHQILILTVTPDRRLKLSVLCRKININILGFKY